MYSDLKECCVDVDATLMDAMRVIDQAGAGIALVVAQDHRLCGTLTDGDIRRAIIRGADLDTELRPHIKDDYLYVSESEGRAEVLDLMQAHLIDQVPVVDDQRTLLGLHLIHGILGTEQRPNRAVIMAGGKGTRLYPLTKNIPKPMVKVAGRPILERLILHLVSHGIHRIFLSVNYLSDVIKEHFGSGERFGCQIEYLHEDEPLGTAGSLSLLSDEPIHPVLVMNGDLVMEANIGQMLSFHQEASYYATLGVSEYFHEVPYGCVKSNGHEIVSLEEKPVASYQVNAGLYVLSPEAVADIPQRFFPITQLFEDALAKNKVCGCYPIRDEWADVGQIHDLKKAQGK